jgi:undecaprenyl-diphosphatase
MRRIPALPHWLIYQDERLCLRINRAAAVGWVRDFFRAVSRLGDGAFWYTLMGWLLAWHGSAALRPVAHMVLTGLACTALYKWLKARTSRPRPYRVNAAIRRGGEPLDEFSFPSGHTLHAVAFALVGLAYFPSLAPVVVPFTVLVALSRVVLGLHYPSDVLAGIVIGALIAGASLLLV